MRTPTTPEPSRRSWWGSTVENLDLAAVALCGMASVGLFAMAWFRA